MDIIEINDRVCIGQTNVSGTVTDISDDGLVTISLDIGGTSSVPQDKVTKIIAEEVPGGSPSGSMVSAGSPCGNTGRFTNGHTGHGRNEEHAAARADARELRQHMLDELAPFMSHIGRYIGQIKTAEKKVDAIAKMAPYCMPSLSKVEFTDETPRNLTAEQELMSYLQNRKK